MPLDLIFISPGTYTLEDNGIPGDNISVIKDGSGTVIFTFAHPADALGFTVSTVGVNIIVNFSESLGAANFTIGNLANLAASPDSIMVRNVATTGTVTLVSNTSITEGGADAGSDITAGAVILSAVSGIGTGANALETRTGLFEAETTTGGITIGNIGSVQIGGLTPDVDGLDVATSGNIALTNTGSIFLTEANTVTAAEVVHGGGTSGNVTLTALGVNADIIGNVDNGAVTAPRGSVTLSAGRDIQLGTIGADFNNDVIANNAVTFTSGRDILIDGFADILSDNFGLDTGANLAFTAGRNIGILNLAGTSASVAASGSGGGDVIMTTGVGGSLTVNGPGSFALGSTSGDVFVNADRILIDGASGISAPSGQVHIRPRSLGREMLLGSASDASTALELSNLELGRIFTPNLTLGSDTAGAISVIADVDLAGAANATLRTSDDILLSAGITTTASLALRGANNVLQSAGTINTGTLTVLGDVLQDDANMGGVVTLNGSVVATARTITGNADADQLGGTGGNDVINGAGGNDILRGFAGMDSLVGGAGADTMSGGLGDDSFIIDHTEDKATEAVGEGTDTVYTTISYALQPGSSIEVLTPYDRFATTAMNLFGNAFNQTIFGNNGTNLISGLGGTDTLQGLGGNDSYIVDDLSDIVIEAAAGGNDTVYTTGSYALPVLNAEIETLSVFDRNTVNALNVIGNATGQIIYGNAGTNTIDGKGGNDQLFGMGGVDSYSFTTALGGGNVDSVTGFTSGEDKILLDDLIFTGLAPGPLPAGVLVVGALPADANDRLLYNQVTGQLFFDADGNGAGAAVLFATLPGGTALATGDFLVI